MEHVGPCVFAHPEHPLVLPPYKIWGIWMRNLFLLLAFLLSSPAQAEWLEASSANFVVYADDSERDVRKFAQQLELYHQAMEVMTGLDLPEPSPSNRLTVFVVRNAREVQRLYGEDAGHIGGFYVPARAHRSPSCRGSSSGGASPTNQ